MSHIASYSTSPRLRSTRRTPRRTTLRDESGAQVKHPSPSSCRSVSSINYARETSRNAHGGQSRVRNARFPRRITDRITRSNPIQSINPPSTRPAINAPHPHPHPRLRAPRPDATHLWILSRAMFKRSNVPRVVLARLHSRASFPPTVFFTPPRVASSTGVVVVSLPRSSSPFSRRVALDVPAVPVPRRDADADASARGRRHPARRGRLPRCNRSVARTPLTLLQPYLNPISTLSQP